MSHFLFMGRNDTQFLTSMLAHVFSYIGKMPCIAVDSIVCMKPEPGAWGKRWPQHCDFTATVKKVFTVDGQEMALVQFVSGNDEWYDTLPVEVLCPKNLSS